MEGRLHRERSSLCTAHMRATVRLASNSDFRLKVERAEAAL
jgi:hypothetical protein